MRTIGLLGGMSWESSAEYYRIINETARDRLGGTHSAKSVMVSVDFHEVEELQAAGDWDGATTLMVEAARRVEAGGADLLVICTNTMHRMADEVGAAIGIPLIHIADATADAVRSAGIGRVGLLGTRYTMEQDFYRGRLESRHGLDVIVPDEPDRSTVHDVIYDELVQGIITVSSRDAYGRVIDRLTAAGANGVILGCTEIELLVTDDLRPVPVFPTTRIHALAAVDAALA
ncbi:MAG: aspartate/glutamate racemase family protein [Acidimicrobiia bacterium]|nr:aspartate/glutamate racemase family protein [Acidimicrobiia bacterium]